MKPPPPLVAYLLAAIFLGLGLVMLAWRKGPNWWIGVRLPWTFADRQLWDRSWNFAALFLVGMGVGALLSWTIFVISLIHLLILGILYPIYLYRRKYGTLKYWKGVARLDYRPVARCSRCGHHQRLPGAEGLVGARCQVCGMPLAPAR
ncbi:MAG: SdpI family protein [Deltaproteobacteria bacterium]|nr:SdpI family protein [Deltaproteobacteria bacterium]